MSPSPSPLPPSSAGRRRQRGLTLVELLTTLAVGSVALGSALPGLQAARERRHFEGAEAQLRTDLQLMRAQSLADDRALRLAVFRDAAGSCYVIHDGSSGQCRCDAQQARCDGGAQALRYQAFPAEQPLQLQPLASTLTHDPVKATFTPTATFRLQGSEGRGLNLVVNLLGRVRACSPGGQLPGYAAC